MDDGPNCLFFSSGLAQIIGSVSFLDTRCPKNDAGDDSSLEVFMINWFLEVLLFHLTLFPFLEFRFLTLAGILHSTHNLCIIGHVRCVCVCVCVLGFGGMIKIYLC